MCFGGGGSNSAAADEARSQAAEARLRDDQRAALVNQGREQINRLFDNGETMTRGPSTGEQVNPVDPRWVGMTPGDVRSFMAGPLGFGMDPASVIQSTPGAPIWNKTGTAFDQAFFDKRRQTSLDYYVPQLADQFQKARDSMGFALARAGLSRSTVAGTKFNDLQNEYNVQNQQIAGKAEGDVNQLRSQVEDARSGLMSSLSATADPESTANQALGRAQVLASAPVNYSPLGDIFSGITGTVGAAAQGYQNAQTTALLNNAMGVGGTTKPRSRAVVVGG